MLPGKTGFHGVPWNLKMQVQGFANESDKRLIPASRINWPADDLPMSILSMARTVGLPRFGQ